MSLAPVIDLLRFDPPPDAPRAPGTLLLFPGGGYQLHAAHEIEPFARHFNALGLVVHALRYPLPFAGHRHPAPLLAAARALRQVRATARAEGRDPAKIALLGCSAGGHLATTLLTRFDSGEPASADPVGRESSRPDLAILCYPVIALSGPDAHADSREHLLGPDATPSLVASLTNDLLVTADTPPCFVWHTADDAVVPVENSLRFARALWRHRVECELHVFPTGVHGLGLPPAHEPSAAWPSLAATFLRRHHFLRP